MRYCFCTRFLQWITLASPFSPSFGSANIFAAGEPPMPPTTFSLLKIRIPPSITSIFSSKCQTPSGVVPPKRGFIIASCAELEALNETKTTYNQMTKNKNRSEHTCCHTWYYKKTTPIIVPKPMPTASLKVSELKKALTFVLFILPV